MTITSMSNPSTMTGAPVRGSDGDKLGKIDAIYLDNATDAPEWAAVRTGLFGGHNTLVPLAHWTPPATITRARGSCSAC